MELRPNAAVILTQALSFDDLFDEARAGRRPAQTAWRPDGAALTYLWDAGGGEALWAMDAETGETTPLLAVAELGEEASLDAYHWAPAGAFLVLESDGDLWLLRPGGEGTGDGEPGRLTRLTATEAAEEAPAISPDGRKLAYVREADLYLLDLQTMGMSQPLERVETPGARGVNQLTARAERSAAESRGLGEGGVNQLRDRAEGEGGGVPLPPPEGGEGSRVRGEIRLTTDGSPGATLNATLSWVYWEEIWNRDPTGFWWSPDSTRIAYYRFDETPLGEYPLIEDYLPPYPEPRRQRYPKAGTANPGAAIGVLELATGETTWLRTEASEESYPARVHWSPDGATVAVERLNREQTRLDLLFCDPASGACREVLSDGHPTWVNLGRETAFLPDGRLLWASERDGWRHLYLYALPEGAAGGVELVRALTAGGWAVASVDHADADAVLATAYRAGPLGAAYRRLLRIPLAGGEPAELAASAAHPTGWHEALVAPGGRHLLHRWSSADEPGWERIEEAGGRVVAELPAEPPAYDPAALPRWEIFRMPDGGAEGDGLPAALLRPAGGGGDAGGPEPGRPILMYHYGGPGSQVVADRWPSRGRGLWHKLMAQRGYGVLTVDNRASVFFGKAGEDRVHRRFGEVNLAAQRSGVAYLATLPWADPSRIGLWGWSGGGSNTLYCMLRSPGTWRSGVAGAPVTDWRYYDTIWTERYLDHPRDNPGGYRDSSPITWAGELRDRLLIVHGTADDNVHPQNTLALAYAWVAAGIPFEMAIYPGQAHGVRRPADRHLYERMTEFFDRTLGGGS